MFCNDIQKQIDLYIDHELTKPEIDRLEEHLSNCSECMLYYEERKLLESKLEMLYQSSAYNTDIDDYVVRTLTKSNKKKYLAVAVLLLTLSITFSQEILLFAEKLPLIEELIAYFSKDKGILELESVGIDTYEGTYLSDDHKLVISDFYWDSYKLYFKFALLDINDQTINDYKWVLKANNYERHSHRTAQNKDPWSIVDVEVLSELIDDESFTLEMIIGNETIVFDQLPLASRLTETTPISITQKIELSLTDGTKYIENLKITPLSMFLSIKSIGNKDYLTTNFFDFYLEDNLGNQYHPTNRASQSDDVRTYELRPSIYHRDIDSLKLVINQRSHIKVDSITSGTIEELINSTFQHADYRLGDYEEKTLSISDLNYGNKLYLTLESNELLISRNFPQLCVWDGSSWVRGVSKEVPSDLSLIKTSLPQLKKFLDVDFNYLAFDNDGLLLLNDLSDVDQSAKIYDGKTPLKLTKLQLKELIDQMDLSISEETLNEFTISWNLFRFTKGEFESVIGHPLEALSEDGDLEIKSIQLLSEYLETYTFKSHSIDSVKEYIKQLIEYGEFVTGYETEVATNRVHYEFYGIPYDRNIELGVVSDLISVEEVIEYDLEINQKRY